MPIFVGLDVGTQGVRAIACDENGQVIAQSSRSFGPEVNVTGLPTGWFEQDPEAWWRTASACLSDVTSLIIRAGRGSGEIVAVAVDSTSGTVLLVDRSGNVIRPAIMYSDTRAQAESDECNEAGSNLIAKLGYRFGPSFGLPKLLWLKRNEPRNWERCHKAIHAADFIAGKLIGDFGISDNSNALKTGYDLVGFCWPNFIFDTLQIEPEKLPLVMTPGDPIGRVTAECATLTGLEQNTTVVAGVSDGTAGFIASGASAVGEWNSTLGTTLVLRGVSIDLVKDPEGRVYCHRHPDGWWLPGGAGNVGGECLTKLFPDADYNVLDRDAASLVPSGLACYPLVRRGERLPFVNSDAEGFLPDHSSGTAALYAACLEGVAFVERWCYELMEELGAPVGNAIYATGGGAKSVAWMRIRAAALKKVLIRPKVTESAMGSAIVAASRTIYSSLGEASSAMVQHDLV
ncbi:MAG: FGGY family carbohydrate kinase, partial [Armatimonadetes bacterium]|nr:FGGY family carbohydrate kinase [Armatimonadota bacterium]